MYRVAVVLAATAFGAAADAAETSARPRPNILYIMTDQQPASCVGAYGNRTIRTPALDTLARNGCRFDRFYIAAFPCSPSRASMLAGRYAHRHGVVTNDVLFDAKIPSLGNLCRAAGYDTAYFGKWHLGGNMYRGRKNKRAPGLGGKWYYERVTGEPCFRFKPVAGGFGEDHPQHGFETWAGGWKHYHEYLRKVGLGPMLDANPSIGNHNDAASGPEGTHIFSRLPAEHHMASFFAQRTEQFIRSHAGGKRPWCAVLSFYGPHLPVAPPKPWDTMYSLDQVPLPANHRDALEGKPVFQRARKRTYVLEKWNDEQFKDYVRRYWGYASYIDQQIGRVLAALRDTKQWKNTIVVFTTDHGDMVGAHGMIFKLGSCGYEELFRIPTIVRIPGVTESDSHTDALASNIDLLPTLLEAAGVPVPDGVDGRSLVPLLGGKTKTHRDMIFADSINRSLICRDERYKFVLNWQNRDIDELYDLEADPGEMKNLALAAESQPVAERMKQRILAWTHETKHPCADLIAQQAARKPETNVLELSAEAQQFKYLGGNEFEMAIVWHVKRPIRVDGKFWAFTHFINPKYADDGGIVFRFTPWPDPPVTEWQAGEEYRIGPVKVRVPPRAGAGNYRVRTGLYDPKRRKSPGVILGGDGNAMNIGTLRIKKDGDRITNIQYQPRK